MFLKTNHDDTGSCRLVDVDIPLIPRRSLLLPFIPLLASRFSCFLFSSPMEILIEETLRSSASTMATLKTSSGMPPFDDDDDEEEEEEEEED